MNSLTEGICVDIFQFGQTSLIGNFHKITGKTGGKYHFYKDWNFEKHSDQLYNDLVNLYTTEQGRLCQLNIRSSDGVKGVLMINHDEFSPRKPWKFARVASDDTYSFVYNLEE